MKNALLRCRVLRGMFSDERVVEFTLLNGESRSCFVAASDVVSNGMNDRGQVRVGVIEREGVLWAVLPTAYSDTVPVRPSEIVAA